MIQHFRKKFILVATLALIVVIVTIAGSISAITYWRSRQEVNDVLTTLVNNEGQMPNKRLKSQSQFLPQPHISGEGLFQYRYFSVVIPKKNSQNMKIDDRHIQTVSPQAIRKLADRVVKKKGYRNQVRYQGTTYAYQIKKTNKQTIIVFLDETLLMSKANEITNLGIMLGLISLVLYTLVLVLFSRRAIRPIIEAEKRQREFITNAGHELKTPLAVISANTEMQEMLSGEDEWTDSTKQQVQRLTGLINRLVSLAKLQERPDMNIIEIDASSVTERVVNSLKSLVLTENKTFESHIQPDIKINADESYFYELVSILLDNANKYCDPNGKVEVTLVRQKKNMVLTIANSYADGAGINYQKLFDRFYRVDKSHTNNQKAGFGIGLSMAQMIVECFKGRIKAKYDKGKVAFIVVIKTVN